MRRLTALSTLFLVLGVPSLFAVQAATVAASNNYRVEFENELVRVVRVTYGPHEKSPMHEHEGNPAVIIILKEGDRIHFVNGDGTETERASEKAGSVRFAAGRAPYKHSVSNLGDRPLETIRVELKPQQPADSKCSTK